MQRRDFLAFSLLAPLAWGGTLPMALAGTSAPIRPAPPDGKPHAFGFGRRRFLLDGREFRIHSGEMHPARIAKEHWRHRIRMARAMGLNTVALYVMWNHHEREPGQFDFETSNRDIVGFIRLCQEEGMWVYLRPGPYVCAEWTNGGLPAWLLRDPDTRLRDGDDTRYMTAVRRYIAELASRIAPLMVSRGGPVLMLQVENEYSMFAADVGYLKAIEAAWRARGIEGPFAVSDGWKDLMRRRAYPPGAALGLDGADVDILAKGRAFAGEAPVWVGEGYPGWLTHWGEPVFASKDYVDTLHRVMKAGYSFNLYVVHGGTNFGLTAGANLEDDGSQFQPVITSYDYGAPIDERGHPTPQYERLRKVIAEAAGITPPAVPPAEPSATFAPVTLDPYASLWENLFEEPARIPVPGPNEILFGQDQGLVLYRKRIEAGSRLRLEGVRDYAVVYMDGHEAGHVSRVEHAKVSSSPEVSLPRGCILDVLVDTFGHVNFGPRLGDHKGLTGPVTLDGAPLRGFHAWPLPLDGAWLEHLRPLKGSPARGGIFFRGKIHLDRPGDVYIDMGEWTKGYLWVNGQLLGRYWHIGPQRRLFCPGPWLREGDNTVMVLDLHRSAGAGIHAAECLHD
ncbi:glycoside hydrolase family 35 protein [Luteibacter yeojuensis]